MHFKLLHTTCIFPVIPIHTLHRNDFLITPYELLCAWKHKLWNCWVLFCPCVVKKYSVTKTTFSGSLISVNLAKIFTYQKYSHTMVCAEFILVWIISQMVIWLAYLKCFRLCHLLTSIWQTFSFCSYIQKLFILQGYFNLTNLKSNKRRVA